MAGYSAEQVADLIASAVHRYMGRERGSVASSGTLIDLEGGWGKVSRRTRQILSTHVFDSTPPPAIDIEAIQEVIKAKHLLGEIHFAESREVRETLALRSLAGNMSNRRTRDRKPFLVGVGAAHRGWCSHCGGRVEAGNVWLLPFSPDRWHEGCLTAP